MNPTAHPRRNAATTGQRRTRGGCGKRSFDMADPSFDVAEFSGVGDDVSAAQSPRGLFSAAEGNEKGPRVPKRTAGFAVRWRRPESGRDRTRDSTNSTADNDTARPAASHVCLRGHVATHK